ncbi:unnamed protein product [Rotaria sordida]|uniref:Uncharacterized protein n=1 Tax=Rotaria sordida TaxID=392033 RepID=A0A819TI85_9BILA|nr:unnamed protein product [Rotaria sordida]CAF1176915.1 unnamed protein product [Rotaria sordida]CAF4013601.1 unnamed protein product [Rotaria sordida]CAF4081735.1 unnamed protein product [Rotaria sordida]
MVTLESDDTEIEIMPSKQGLNWIPIIIIVGSIILFLIIGLIIIFLRKRRSANLGYNPTATGDLRTTTRS